MTVHNRARVVGQIADHLVMHRLDHPLRTAVDGITAAGKTMLARELTAAIEERGRTAIRLSGDDFHHRSAHRYRQGRDSADGYYEDAYDFGKLAQLTLAPLGPGGNRCYHARVHDLSSDAVIDDDIQTAPQDAILVMDGSFMQRADLAEFWDLVLFVDTSFEVARNRGAARDSAMFGGRARAQHAYDSRYHAACRRYVHEVSPADRASIVLGNDTILDPELRRMERSPRAAAHEAA